MNCPDCEKLGKEVVRLNELVAHTLTSMFLLKGELDHAHQYLAGLHAGLSGRAEEIRQDTKRKLLALREPLRSTLDDKTGLNSLPSARELRAALLKERALRERYEEALLHIQGPIDEDSCCGRNRYLLDEHYSKVAEEALSGK